MEPRWAVSPLRGLPQSPQPSWPSPKAGPSQPAGTHRSYNLIGHCGAREGPPTPPPGHCPAKTHHTGGQGSAGTRTRQALGPHHLVLLHVG